MILLTIEQREWLLREIGMNLILMCTKCHVDGCDGRMYRPTNIEEILNQCTEEGFQITEDTTMDNLKAFAKWVFEEGQYRVKSGHILQEKMAEVGLIELRENILAIQYYLISELDTGTDNSSCEELK